MAKQFDATTRHLIEAHPRDWLAYAGLPPATRVRVVDSDLSSVTTAADKVILVEEPDPYVTHVEFQSGADADVDERVQVYNGMLRLRRRLPVRSVLILLRPQAAAGVRGGVTVADHPYGSLDFRYRVVRVWERPPEEALAGGLGTLPLAPISAVPEADLPRVIEQMRQRLAGAAPPAEVRELWTATSILLGLRYPRRAVAQLLSGVTNMEESDTYQAILEKGIDRGVRRGRFEEARDALLRLGRRRFGPPDAAALALVDAVTELARLERLQERVLDVGTWKELFDAP